MRAKLTKLGTIPDKEGVVGDQPLRTDSIEGIFAFPPKVGESFSIINDEPLEDKQCDGRIVTTSIVAEVTKVDLGFQFKTLNSLYFLQLIPLVCADNAAI